MYELNRRDAERLLCVCEQFIQRQKRKGLLHGITTADERWAYLDDSKRKKTWRNHGHASMLTARPSIHNLKIMLCIWWENLGVVYYGLL